MEEPKSPKAWANFLVTVWGDRFPIKVRTIALEYSKRFPDPLKDITPASVGATFEGALYPLRKSGKWAILYNPHIRQRGRINFTLGHELGHYWNHRHLKADGFECSDLAVLGYDVDAHRRKLEQEADEFASYLLMPINDYRAQVRGQQMTLELLSHCANRYEVSATAAALKWLRFTEDRAVLLYARDGHILWGQRSDPAKKIGIYFSSGMELPVDSIAVRGPAAQPTSAGVELAEGIWSPTERVREIAIFADQYDATITLLVWPKVPPPIRFGTGEPHVEDTFDRFSR